MLTKLDEEQLKLLSVFYYVLAGVKALFSGLFLLGFGVTGVLFLMGAIQMPNPPHQGGEEMVVFGGVFLTIGLVIGVLGLGMAYALYLAGRNLAQHKGYTYCFVISIILLLGFPIGTALGIFTLMVINRDQVKAQMTSLGMLA